MPVVFREARGGDCDAVFALTRRSVAALAKDHYSSDQIAGWMGERTPAFYEEMITKGRMVVAERDGVVVGFVDAEPGELTRLFVSPEEVGGGVGSRLLAMGVNAARAGGVGPIRVEATLNAESFYLRHGFRRIGLADFSHGLGGAALKVVVMQIQEDASGSVSSPVCHVETRNSKTS